MRFHSFFGRNLLLPETINRSRWKFSNKLVRVIESEEMSSGLQTSSKLAAIPPFYLILNY